MTNAPMPGSYEDDALRAFAIAKNFSRHRSRKAAKVQICNLGIADDEAGAEELIRKGERLKGENAR